MDLLRKKTMRKCKRAFQFGISATGLQGDFFKITTYVMPDLVSLKCETRRPLYITYLLKLSYRFYRKLTSKRDKPAPV